ncbi:hypothetical protein ACE1SV_67430 [Streptomyces sennicomposti]
MFLSHMAEVVLLTDHRPGVLRVRPADEQRHVVDTPQSRSRASPGWRSSAGMSNVTSHRLQVVRELLRCQAMET